MRAPVSLNDDGRSNAAIRGKITAVGFADGGSLDPLELPCARVALRERALEGIQRQAAEAQVRSEDGIRRKPHTPLPASTRQQPAKLIV